ncbi:hypothetical protein Apa02nite_072090 [Actinoplanes palleronii]|uniref:Uncharacterized protein n=1 Tax=Actinoplanes palleronii TaxID=113570 RepID=A0ABQ4BKA4_9ACTN|nr:hypothetical protein Apa02nite_072090 [Actinoplanes palleronii]
MPGALLVAHQDVPDAGVEQRIVRREDRAARDPEHDFHAQSLERADKCAGTRRGYRSGSDLTGRGRGDGGRSGSMGEGFWRGSRHGNVSLFKSASGT